MRSGARHRLSALSAIAVWLTILLPFAPGTGAAQQDPVAWEIQLRMERLERSGELSPAGTRIRATPPLLEAYRLRGSAPFWHDETRAGALEGAILAVARDGLDPDHYHLRQLTGAPPPTDPGAVADLDLLRTDALLRLAHDLRFGRVDPVSPARPPDPGRALFGNDPARDLLRLLDAPNLDELLRALRPTEPGYARMVEALAFLRLLEAAGGWEPIPAGPLLRAGESDPRVPSLRIRLATSGDLQGGITTGEQLDEGLELALRAFQRRHALNEDGVLGPATLQELNVPVGRRIDQLRVNLDRLRAGARDTPADHVAVNIAGARTALVRGGAIAWEARSIVGRRSTPTPEFRATMEHIELNPTWTVPPGIVAEIQEEIRRQPDYLQRQAIRVLDRSGREVRVSTAELLRYRARDLPYVFRQDPGPLNPLGQIKFIFPNPHHVYLHDTPNRTLFEREVRTFSHGCIRLQDPIGFAVRVLDDPSRWGRAELESSIAGGRTTVIRLRAPLPVIVRYRTADVDREGQVIFFRDIYERDPAVLRALGEPSISAAATLQVTEEVAACDGESWRIAA